MKNLHVIIDGQYGSTGKGLLAGVIAKEQEIDTICTAWGPNSGHTFIDRNGREYIHTMLANGIVGPNVKRILIGPGSVINPDNLQKEWIAAWDQLQDVGLAIHPHAAIVTDEHRNIEDKTMTAIGSTKKGVGEAIIQRIRRDPNNSNVAKDCKHPFIKDCVVSTSMYQSLLAQAKNVLIEGCQGYSLSMYHGFYPYTTSRDVSTHQALADCAIPYGVVTPSIYGCFRTYPIRVANRFDEDGNMVGTSGPCYPDQMELSWADVGREPELTTVTKLPRRIFSWSNEQYKEAIRMLGVTHPFMNFMNYIQDEDRQQDFITELNKVGPRIAYLGFGPKESDVINTENAWYDNGI